MSVHDIAVQGGNSIRLSTSGKYCDRDIIVTVPEAPQATPSISVSDQGLITASATQDEGYVSAGTKSSTFKLLAQVGKTVTPTTTEQTAVAVARYTTGVVKVAGDAKLVASNIKKGVSIFGVDGSFEGSGAYDVRLPTRTVTVTDQDGGASIVVTALVNENGKLIYKSKNVPSGGSVTITYAWYTPIFIKSAYLSWLDVYDCEGDYMRYCPYYYDSVNTTFAVFPQSDGGDNHQIYACQ